jgi:hypothetical protein
MSDGQDALDMVISYVPCLLGILCGTWSTWVEGDIVDVTGPAAGVWARPDARVGERVGPLSLPAKRDEAAPPEDAP